MVAPAAPARTPAPLSIGHFRRIARRGFGDGRNSYAYSYAWFNGHLFIGTNRDLLVLLKRRFRFDVPMAVWPVPAPEQIDPANLCAEIWRYSPARCEWRRVYRSPLVTGREGRTVPLATGFRNMAVFQGRSDPAPALYTIPSCGSYGQGVVLMRCLDGENFEVVSEPGMGLGNDNITSFRGVIAFKGRLFATPSGSRGANPNVSHHAAILCTDDPLNGRWQVANPLAFGDPTNLSIHDMAVCGDWLYAGTMNVKEGFQIWKTRAEGEPPFEWHRVLERGADRGPFNQVVVSMCELNGDLFVGTGIQNGGHDRIHNIGPAAGEVIRVRPDDSWELLVGDARWTREGLTVPLSGMGPGWDNPFAGYIWRMCEHEGWLYVGTFDSSSFLPFARLDERVAQLLDPETIQRFLRVRGGAELWRTRDGKHWTPVTRNGFGNPFNYGVRALVSCPWGLFVGTANPFGPQVAVRTPAGWRYEDNPHGGLEVFHGSPAHAGIADEDDAPLRRSDATLRRRGHASLRRAGWDDAPPGPDDAPRAAAGGSEPVPDAPLMLGGVCGEGCGSSDDCVWDPLLRLALSKDLAEAQTDVRRELREYFAGELQNAGLWREPADKPRAACLALLDELAFLLSEPLAHSARPSVLLLCRGAEEAARVLRNRWPHARWTLGWFDTPPAAPAPKSPDGAEWLRCRRGNRLHLPPERFDAILSIEALAGCQLQQALPAIHRALRPGGVLAAAELIEELPEGQAAAGDLEAAVRALQAAIIGAGFSDLRLTDITGIGWTRFFRHSRLYFTLRLYLNQMDSETHRQALEALPGGRMIVAAQVLCSARRPQGD